MDLKLRKVKKKSYEKSIAVKEEKEESETFFDYLLKALKNDSKDSMEIFSLLSSFCIFQGHGITKNQM